MHGALSFHALSLNLKLRERRRKVERNDGPRTWDGLGAGEKLTLWAMLAALAALTMWCLL